MSRYKFRVWDKEFEETLTQDEGTFQYRDRYDYWVTDLEDAMGNPERFTIMQYTGLKDVNGVEIYEGDIATMIVFKDNAEYLGYVVFENGCFCLNISLDGAKYKVPASEWKETETIITVIGNVYENPALLERELE